MSSGRNPLLIYVFCAIGMVIRFAFFYCISLILGKKPRALNYFSEGFKQILYNLILLLFLMFASILVFVYSLLTPRF
jgi:hypothetical protein